MAADDNNALPRRPRGVAPSGPVVDPPRDLSQRAHRRLIGYLGLALPLLVYAVAGLRHTDGLSDWVLLRSVSAYYYTGATGVFVGVLFALSLFLFTYRGYQGVAADRVVGALGGAAALGVALFPTGAPENLSAPSWWHAGTRIVHYASAVLLFSAFILFSIWLFRKSSVPDPRHRPPDKRKRDAVCLVCAITMIGSLLWAVAAARAEAPIFWPEAIAIIAFAVSWLAKGEVLDPMLRAIPPRAADPTAG